jgi:hypothetical protein
LVEHLSKLVGFAIGSHDQGKTEISPSDPQSPQQGPQHNAEDYCNRGAGKPENNYEQGRKRDDFEKNSCKHKGSRTEGRRLDHVLPLLNLRAQPSGMIEMKIFKDYVPDKRKTYDADQVNHTDSQGKKIPQIEAAFRNGRQPRRNIE